MHLKRSDLCWAGITLSCALPRCYLVSVPLFTAERPVQWSSSSPDFPYRPADLFDRAQELCAAAQAAVESSVAILGDWASWRRAPVEVITAEHLVVICAYCHRLRTTEMDWVKAPPAVEHAFQADGAHSMLSHGCCPECYQTYSPD